MKQQSNKFRYASDKTFKEKLEIWFIKDHRKAIKFRIFNLILKATACLLYLIEVIMDPLPANPELYMPELKANATAIENTDKINWTNILYVRRHPVIQIVQLIIGVYGFLETSFYFILTYNGNFWHKVSSPYFLIEIVCTIPWILEYTVPYLNNIFIPVFLNCWLIKRNLNYVFKDFNNINVKHQNSVIGQHLISLGTLLSCLFLTSVCGFQQLQRANINKWTSLTDSLYYTVITFSTVGYGDITPDTWPSKMFMCVMIIIALVVIPTQIEHLASLWFERQNLGASYSSHRSAHEKHVVLCSTALQYDLIIDFLNEFYAHRKNHAVHTILLSSSELDIQLRSLLHTPLWKERVFYIHGSALRDSDLERAKVHQAKAVFIIPSRGIDKDLADQHSILRSWAIKDFAPNTPQFVQLFRPENVINIKFAEYMVCEDEFKYGLLANDCLCPGISTLVTLLLHKSTLTQNIETTEYLESWQELYSKLAGNEIHSITAENSKFFQEFIGKSFTSASCIAHKKYNVCLIGIGSSREAKQSYTLYTNEANSSSTNSTSMATVLNRNVSQSGNKTILLNPGPDYLIQPQDHCFYISQVKEENYNWKVARTKIFAVEELCQNLFITGPELSLRRIASQRLQQDDYNNFCSKVLEQHSSEFNEDSNLNTSTEEKEESKSSKSTRKAFNTQVQDADVVIGKPPNPLYIGCNPTSCKLLKVPNSLCCLQLNRECEHKKFTKASDYAWRNKCILIVAECATNGLFNFILPLRSHVRSNMFMKPIIMLLENPPSSEFLEAVSCFPLIYWMQGSITNINTILKAGIMESDTVIVVSPERFSHIDDDSLTDCTNIVAVQNLYRLFPKLKIVAELTKASNIRFMKVRAKQMKKEQSSNMAYMFRIPFASGSVFSASMIDTLLYQTYGKPYLIELIRLLIGLSQTPGSGNLTSIPLTDQDMWIKTYGNLYRKLITTTGEIPIGIYRTLNKEKLKYSRHISKEALQQMVATKMTKLGIETDRYSSSEESFQKYSFVLINPAFDFQLQSGDIIYLLKPGQPHSSTSMDEIMKRNHGSISSLTHDLERTMHHHPHNFSHTKHNSLDFLSNRFNLPGLKHNLMPTSLSASLKSYLNKKQAEEDFSKFNSEPASRNKQHVTISDEVNFKKINPNNVTYI